MSCGAKLTVLDPTTISLSTSRETAASLSLSSSITWASASGAAVYYDLTATWDAQPTLVAEQGVIYVYSDHVTKTVVGSTVFVPGVKIGDGTSYLIDMPFLDQAVVDQITEHAEDGTIHITAAERDFWNNKVSAEYSDEALILSTD